jgi:hypothetical protein
MEKDEKRIMLILYTWEQDVLEISGPYTSFCFIFFTRARYDDLSSSSSLGCQVVQKEICLEGVDV